jgi:hypothetical protein
MVTGEKFLAMMEYTPLYHIPARTVFQLEGAPPHFSHRVHAFLDIQFPIHWIGRSSSILWPPHSPHLTYIFPFRGL